MSTRTARALSIVVAAVAIAMIVAAVPVARAAEDADRTSIVVVPGDRRADIERAIELGGGCTSPVVDQALADATAVYCELQGRTAAGELFDTVGPADPFAIIASLVGLLWIGTGFLIVSRRGTNLAGWTFELVGLGIVALNSMLTFAYVGVAVPGTVPAVGLWAIVDEYAVFSLALLPMLWLLFPDGKPPTPRWGVLVRVYFGALAVVAAVAVLMPGPFNNLVDFGIIYLNPVGQSWIADVGGAVMAAGMITVFAITVGSVFATRRRFKRADGEERQRLRWLRFVISIAVVLFLVSFLGSLVFAVIAGEDSGPADDWFRDSFALLALTLALGLPAAYLVAIYRYGLWDLDLVDPQDADRRGGRHHADGDRLGLLLLIPVMTLAIGAGTLDAEAVVPVDRRARARAVVRPDQAPGPPLRRPGGLRSVGRRRTRSLESFSERLSETYSADDVLPRMAQVLAQATGAEVAVVWLRIGDALRPEARWPADAAAPEAVTTDGEALPTPSRRSRCATRASCSAPSASTMPANDPLDPARDQLVARPGGTGRARAPERPADRESCGPRASGSSPRRTRSGDGSSGTSTTVSQQQLVALSVQLRLAEQLVPNATRRRSQDDARRPAGARRPGRWRTYATWRAASTRPCWRTVASRRRSRPRRARPPSPPPWSAEAVGRYPREVESTVYFCTLEALNNVAKYADASRTDITLSQRDGTLEFVVRDDGRGFDVARAVDGDRSAGNRRPPRRDRRHVHDRE